MPTEPGIDLEVKALGLVEVLWTVDSRDSLGADYAQIAHNVIAGLHPGSIILMHENRGQTVRALATIFPALKRSHLTPVDPADPAVRRSADSTPAAGGRPGLREGHVGELGGSLVGPRAGWPPSRRRSPVAHEATAAGVF